jgi:uncharacterized membrane protein affecting hemolysin expression
MNKGYYSDSSEFKGTGKRVVIILICVALLFGLMYFLTTRILSKEVTKKRKQNEVTESSIQYEKILAGESFTMDQEEYYVVYYDSTDTELSKTISTYQSDKKDIKCLTKDAEVNTFLKESVVGIKNIKQMAMLILVVLKT